MGDRVNLSSRADDIVADAIYDMKTLDLDALRDEVSERVYEGADSACIYYHDCETIIDDYERDHGSDADDMGSTFLPSQYREAMQAYAYGVASAALHSYTYAALEAVEEAGDQLVSDLSDLDVSVSLDELAVTRACPHGWAAHDSEDADGTHRWVSGQLDGCNALAIEVSGIWLSYTWNEKDRLQELADDAEIDASPDSATVAP